jgi:hypothetical protein
LNEIFVKNKQTWNIQYRKFNHGKRKKTKKKRRSRRRKNECVDWHGLPVAKARKNSSCKDCISVLQNAPEESRVNARIAVDPFASIENARVTAECVDQSSAKSWKSSMQNFPNRKG